MFSENQNYVFIVKFLSIRIQKSREFKQNEKNKHW